MTKKITPNFLRHVVVLLIFSQSINFFSQSVNISISVNWPNWSSENKIELLDPSNNIIFIIDNGYTGSTNDSHVETKSTNPNVLQNSSTTAGYSVKIYDTYGDGWNSSGFATINVDGVDVLTVNNNSFNSIPGSGGEIVSNNIYFAVEEAPNLDDASFTYPNSSYAISDADPVPTIIGESGGTFTSTSGLVIDSSTGLIDVSASTLGNYVVTYTTTEPDQNSAQQNITISFATSQYYDNSKKYIEYIPGTMPVIISAPHGGVLQSGKSFGGVFYPDDNSLPDRGCGTNEQDDNTDVVIKEIQKKCFEQFGEYPYIIVSNLHRSKLDPNRNKSVATCNNTAVSAYFDAYHSFIDQASADVTTKFGKGLYIDLHGQSHPIPRVEAGYNLYSSSYDENLNNSATNAVELSRVTIKNLIQNNIQNLSFEDLIRGSQSFGGLLQTTGGSEYASLGHAGCNRTEGYRTVPSHISTGSSQGSCDDTNPGNNAYFAGDYYSNIRHGSGDQSQAHSVVQGGGLVNGGGGTIDGIMTEVNRRVRDMGNLLTSYDGRQDTRSSTIPFFARDYAKVIEKYIDLHYNDFSKFSYSENTYSIYGTDATPTINGISGGTFSSTSGLVINSATGEIDVSASTPGNYTITYVAPNVGDYYKKESLISINTDPVTNEFIATSGDWSLITNWSLNRLPISTDNVLIDAGKTANLNLDNIAVTNLTVAGNLNINANKSITVTGNLNTTGNLSVNNASIIVNGTSTGNITYNRNMNANRWYLIGAPVNEQSVADFVTAHPNLAKGSGSGTGRNVALAIFDNTKTAPNPKWGYYKVGQVDGLNSDDTTDLMNSGLGYTTRLTSSGDISFTGTLQTENVNKAVTMGANAFNLIANPYSSYINSATFLSENTGVGKSLKTQTLWIWDQTLNGGAGDYTPRITLNNFKIAPGQAFFVETIENGSVTFSKSSQNHHNTDTFSKTNRPEIKLNITDGTNSKFTEVYYIDGTTTGFDDGYDGEVFGGITSDFQVYTGLVEDQTSKKLSIQSIPNSNHENMIIPIGVYAKSGSEIVFTTENKNIPAGLNVYLEDKINDTFIELNTTEKEYKTIIDTDLNGVGNYYLHTKSSSVLSTDDLNQNLITVSNFKNTITITGLSEKNIKLEVYSILGKKVLSKQFTSKGASKIELPKLASGIYLVKLKTESKEITKKIIIE